ncbi:MAG TPA: hypothetical protein VLG69_03975 [Candidatus Andersenbacteria bacterium]|nr:hypothetical protein [Candidatus Andersenbacteria bacterium]
MLQVVGPEITSIDVRGIPQEAAEALQTLVYILREQQQKIDSYKS